MNRKGKIPKDVHRRTSNSVDNARATSKSAVSHNVTESGHKTLLTAPQNFGCELSTEITWAFESDFGYELYNSVDAVIIETTFQSKTSRFALVCSGRYSVDVIMMIQRNVSSGYTRKVKRITKESSGLSSAGAIIRDDTSKIELLWKTSPTFVSKDVKKYSIVGDPGSQNTRDLIEYNMAYGQFLRLIQAGRLVTVTQVDVYENQRLRDCYNHTRSQLSGSGRSCEEIWVFHGTSAENVAAIMLNGFQAGGSEGVPIVNGAVFGNGIYTAKGPDTPMSYGSGARQVILARALRGRCGRDSTGGDDSWEPKGDWVVFRKGEQLLPVFVVHFHDASGLSAERGLSQAKSTPAIAAANQVNGPPGLQRTVKVQMTGKGPARGPSSAQPARQPRKQSDENTTVAAVCASSWPVKQTVPARISSAPWFRMDESYLPLQTGYWRQRANQPARDRLPAAIDCSSQWYNVPVLVMGTGTVLTFLMFWHLKLEQMEQQQIAAQKASRSWPWSLWNAAPVIKVIKPSDFVALKMLLPLGASYSVAVAAATFPVLPWVLSSAAAAATDAVARPSQAPSWGLLVCSVVILAFPRLLSGPWFLGIGACSAAVGGYAGLAAELCGLLLLTAVAGRQRIPAILAVGAVGAQTTFAAAKRAPDVALALCGAALVAGAGSASLPFRQLLGTCVLIAAVLLFLETLHLTLLHF